MSALRHWSLRIGALATRARRARLFRDAFWVLLFSVLSRGLMVFGSAHAARCLGPASMGISGQIQVMVQQLGLAYNGGFDMVASRIVAQERREALPTLRRVISFRLGIALALALGWVAVTASHVHPDAALHRAWLLGAVLVVVGALNTNFLYQGIEKMPLLTAIGSAGSAVTAAIYLLVFQPGFPVGSDLIVTSSVSLITAALALGLAAWLVPAAGDRQPARSARSWSALGGLLRQGWRYWLLAVMVYLYAGFPLLLIAHFRDDSAAGVFRVAFMMAGAVELLFGSINNLLLPRMVEWRQESSGMLWKRQALLVPLHFALGLTATLLAFLLAPWFFTHFLGNRFSESVTLFQILVAGRAVVFIGQIYAYGLIALHLDTAFLLATLAGTVTSLGANLLLIPRYGTVAAALVSVASELVTCLSCFWFERRHIASATHIPPAA